MNKIMLLLSILVCFALQSAEMSLLRRGSEGQALKEQQELIDNQQEASLPVQVVGLENIQNIIDKNKSEAITYLSDEIKRIDDIALDLINQDLDNAVKNIHAFKIKDYIEKLRAVIELLNDNQFRNALDSLNELEKEYPEEIEFKESKIRLNNIIKILNESLSNVIEESPTRNVLITLNSILEKIDQQDLYERHLYRGKLQEQEKA
ncbi:MAG: hypothetical protein P4L22_01935, partial [Candidatus Babeliales bacterium]|nr:hypothetical protein [Candidatus Babeliales bacterium]